jgi:hypothetical protein
MDTACLGDTKHEIVVTRVKRGYLLETSALRLSRPSGTETSTIAMPKPETAERAQSIAVRQKGPNQGEDQHGVVASKPTTPMTSAGAGRDAGVALMLLRFRTGDSDMRAVWICSRNDAIGNLAVITAAAAAGVFGTGTRWPDIIVAAIMASLSIRGGRPTTKTRRRRLVQQLRDLAADQGILIHRLHQRCG